MAPLVLTSRPGQELYIASGTRFTVTLDQPAYFSGAAVRTAQQNFKQNPGPYGIDADSDNGNMPKLKHRRTLRNNETYPYPSPCGLQIQPRHSAI